MKKKRFKKGINKYLRFPDYEKCVLEQVSIKSIKHIIYTIISNKIALLKINYKEVIDEDSIKTYPLEINILFISMIEINLSNSNKILRKISKKVH